MNKTFTEADDLVNDIMNKLESVSLKPETQLIVCPPFPFLEMVSDYSDDSYFEVGAQNVSDQESGAYTGEVSAAMLESMEIGYCIVGHSERRAYYHETDAIVAAKVNQLLKHGLKPIVCCGEVLEERESNQQFEVVKRQINDGLFHLTAEQFGEVVIAYEPVHRRCTPLSAASLPRSMAKRWPRRPAFCTAAAASPATPKSCLPTRMLTAD